MSSTLQCLVLAVVMAASSYAAGMLPLLVSLSPAHMALASLASMGMLTATALVIVVPEGVATVYTAGEGDSRAIGLLLLCGFALMYVLDHADAVVPRWHRSSQSHSAVRSVLSSSLTLGLLVHALVDGVALGTSFTRRSAFSVIMFVSIIVHKLPTCFSLTTMLVREGYPQAMAKVHLAVFAFASPVSCVATYAALSVGSLAPSVVGYLLLFSAGTFFYVVIHVMLDAAAADPHKAPPSQDSEFTIVDGAEPPQPMTAAGLAASLAGMAVPIALSLLED
ncbi:Zinc/iron permease [[Candida] zeylanoides]